MLACFITLGTWAALNALVAPSRVEPDPRRRWWLLGAGAALAGGFLTKGPVGVVLPAIVVGPLAIWRCWTERVSRPDGTGARLTRLTLDVGMLALVVLLLAGPWFAAMTATHGLSYLDRFFLAENVERFVTPRYNTPRPLWYYLPIVAAGLLPWSPFMLVWWRPIRRLAQRARRIQAVEVWLVVWALAPLFFYSVSAGKQPRYILPILPPLAVLLARGISRRCPRSGPNGERPRPRQASCRRGCDLRHRARDLRRPRVSGSKPVDRRVGWRGPDRRGPAGGLRSGRVGRRRLGSAAADTGRHRRRCGHRHP